MSRYCFRWMVLSFGLISATGCGASLSPVTGEVKMDGAAVAGATVTFVSEDGNHSYSAPTNASGQFTLATGEKLGIPAGTYKVLVVKFPSVTAAESMNPADADYMKMMEKSSKDADKAARASMMPPPNMGMGGMRPPAGMMPGSGSGVAAPKSELPPIYSNVTTTTLTVKVPLETTPVTITLQAPAGPKKK